jgi:L-rhamnose mutarotase
MKYFKLSFLILLAFLQSCNEIGEATQQSSTGGINEILVVTNNVQQWDGEIGDSIRSNFSRNMEVLPVAEPQFKMVNVNEASLGKMLFKKHHNIFIINIDPQIKDAYVESRENLWAEPQMVIKINAPNIHEFLISFEEIRENAFDLFIDVERSRIQSSYSNKFKNQEINRQLHKYMQLDLDIPKGYTIAKIDSNNAWMRKETAANSMNVLIYIRPYKSTSDFDPNNIKKRRNGLTRTYIPGPTTGSYQLISDEYIEPVFNEITFNDLFAVETRGLWRVENDFMGGPFISYTFVDETQGRLITIDGFTYAPKQKKAPLVRELEAILWSVEILD